MQEKDFATKRNALFACLDDASKEIKGTILDQGENLVQRIEIVNPRYNYKRSRRDMETGQTLSYMRGRESIFKKPEMPITRCLKARKTPDYQINPHKWKKYSLSDVDISDHTNTAAAFSFLKQMDEQRNDADDDEEAASISSPKKIEFKKSSKIARNIRALEEKELPDAEVDKPKLKGSKLVMPEYIVGQRQKNANKRKQGSGASGSKASEKSRAAGSLRLSHLQDEDENADDDDQDDFMTER